MVRRETSQNGPLELLPGHYGVLQFANYSHVKLTQLWVRRTGQMWMRGTRSPETGPHTPPRPSRWPSQAFLVETLAIRVFWVRWPEGLVSRRRLPRRKLRPRPLSVVRCNASS
jgi:hypothetical protein